jgi:hypothetical protein
MFDDKSDVALNTAELLPNMCDNHLYMVIVIHIWPSVTGGCHKLLAQCQNYLAAVLEADQGDRKRRNLFRLVLVLDYDL